MDARRDESPRLRPSTMALSWLTACVVLAAASPALLPPQYVVGRIAALDPRPGVRVLGTAPSAPAAVVVRETEEVLRMMSRRTGLSVDGLRVRVRVCSSNAEYRGAGGPSNTDACFVPPDRIVLRTADSLRQDLGHELVHALVRHASRSRCPLWLEEGIVNHETRVTPTGQYTPDLERRIAGALEEVASSGRGWSLAGLNRRSGDGGAIEDAFYGGAWFATRHLYGTYGRDSVLLSLRLMGERGTERGFRAAFGRSPEQVEAEWRRRLDPGKRGAGARAGARVKAQG